jgi:hypothetical protein
MPIDQPAIDHQAHAAEVRPHQDAPAGGSASERLRSGHIGHELTGLATAAAAMHLAEQIRQSLLGSGTKAADHRAAWTDRRAESAEPSRSEGRP